MQRLAADDVEVLGRGRAVDDADVLLRGELHEALEARTGMLGPVALVAVREEQGEPRGLMPLREAGDDELVDHDLGRVDEVAELRLPQDERGRTGHGVAVLEADRGHLAQGRVVDLHRGRRGREVGERRVDAPVLVVVKDEVPVGERASFRVLTGQANRGPGDDEARKGEILGLGPVDASFFTEGLAAALELLDELRMDRETFGHGEELIVQLAQDRAVHGGLDRDIGSPAEPLLLLLLR
jgi:hypothetical protein